MAPAAWQVACRRSTLPTSASFAMLPLQTPTRCVKFSVAMRAWLRPLSLIVISACSFPRPVPLETETDASVGADASEARPDALDSATDATAGSSDAPVSQMRCDSTKPFGAPTLVENINSSLDENYFALSRDGSIAFVTRYLGEGTGNARTLLSASRSPQTGAFDSPSATFTASINALGDTYEISSTSDGLRIYCFQNNGGAARCLRG